jgi:hypothetical protein
VHAGQLFFGGPGRFLHQEIQQAPSLEPIANDIQAGRLLRVAGSHGMLKAGRMTDVSGGHCRRAGRGQYDVAGRLSYHATGAASEQVVPTAAPASLRT